MLIESSLCVWGWGGAGIEDQGSSLSSDQLGNIFIFEIPKYQDLEVSMLRPFQFPQNH